MYFKVNLISFLLVVLLKLSKTLCEPLSTALVGIGSIAVGSFSIQKLSCLYNECCSDKKTWTTEKWIQISPQDLYLLSEDLSNIVHGQPLVKSIVIKALSAHLRKENPEKPLVLSFHGWPGSGKTYVSEIIAKRLYKEGIKSSFYHHLQLTRMFPYPDNIDKEKLINIVEENLNKCGRQLFVYDEVDKMPSSFIDIIKSFVDFSNQNIERNKAIHIFLSNTGGSEITRSTFNLWQHGKDRSDIIFKDLEASITLGAFNEVGGMKKSDIVSKYLIDFYVPFLPLEKVHVKLCIKDIIERNNYAVKDISSFIEKVANDIDYYPPEIGIYSKSGCKKLESRILFHLS